MVNPPPAAQLVVGAFPMDRRSDADLVRLVAEGNDAALAVVFRRYGLVVRRTLQGQLRHDAAVDDLTQEVFLGFHRTAGNITEPEKLRAYLIGTAFRQAKQHIRQKVRRRRLLGFFGDSQQDTDFGAPTAHARDDLRCLHEVLERLPERLRDSFILRYIDDLGPQDVADARNVSLATAKRDIARARERVVYHARREPALSGYLRGHESLAPDVGAPNFDAGEEIASAPFASTPFPPTSADPPPAGPSRTHLTRPVHPARAAEHSSANAMSRAATPTTSTPSDASEDSDRISASPESSRDIS